MSIAAIVTLVSSGVTLIGYVLNIIRELKNANVAQAAASVKLMDWERAIKIAQTAVTAAEELGAEGGNGTAKWSPIQKRDYAVAMLKTALPELDKGAIDGLIHSALTLSELGAQAWEEVKDKTPEPV